MRYLLLLVPVFFACASSAPRHTGWCLERGAVNRGSMCAKTDPEISRWIATACATGLYTELQGCPR